MNKIHRKVEYAMVALKHMAQKQPDQLTTVKEICSQYGCPFDATSRVMQVMVQKKLLKSEQGAQGGYRILRDLTDVTLYDLIEAVVGPMSVVRCLEVDNPRCEMSQTCNVIQPLAQLNDQLIAFYKGIVIAELLKVEQQPIPLHNVSGQYGAENFLR